MYAAVRWGCVYFIYHVNKSEVVDQRALNPREEVARGANAEFPSFPRGKASRCVESRC